MIGIVSSELMEWCIHIHMPNLEIDPLFAPETSMALLICIRRSKFYLTEKYPTIMRCKMPQYQYLYSRFTVLEDPWTFEEAYT